MKVELDDKELEKIIKALEFYFSYSRAQRREDNSYTELADRLKKKEPQSETRQPERAVKKRG